MYDAQSSFVPVIASLSLLFSVILIFKAPTQGLYLLPLPLMIGPAFSLPVGGVNATMGDFYSTLLILRVMLPYTSRLNVGIHPIILVGSMLLFLSVIFSAEILPSFVGLTKITQFALLVWASNILLKPNENVYTNRLRNIFTAWSMVTTLCAIMMLWFLYKGQPYFLLTWATGTDMYEITDLDQSVNLYRTMFFYTNIFVPLGLSLVYALMAVLMSIEVSKFKRFFLLLSLPINTAALVANNTRSMLLPVAVLTVLVLTVFFWRILLRSQFRSKSNFLILIMLSLIMVGVANSGSVLMSASQLIVLQERITDSSSMEARLSVWGSVIFKVLDDPLRLLVVGWGPQATTRQGGEIMKEFLTGSQGNTEGAFDSTPIGFLVEYGAILTTLAFSYITVWFFRLWKYSRKNSDAFALTLLLLGAAVAFASLTQQFTFSAPAFMALQLFAFMPNVRRSQFRGHDSPSHPAEMANGRLVGDR
jgi:hypothetical protein